MYHSPEFQNISPPSLIEKWRGPPRAFTGKSPTYACTCLFRFRYYRIVHSTPVRVLERARALILFYTILSVWYNNIIYLVHSHPSPFVNMIYGQTIYFFSPCYLRPLDRFFPFSRAENMKTRSWALPIRFLSTGRLTIQNNQ